LEEKGISNGRRAVTRNFRAWGRVDGRATYDFGGAVLGKREAGGGDTGLLADGEKRRG